jgi:hypothetical protein
MKAAREDLRSRLVKFSAFTAALVVVLYCSIAVSSPLPLIPTVASAGQTKLTTSNGASNVFVDWMVLNYSPSLNLIPPPTGPAYLYLYQLENPTAQSNLAALTLNLSPAAASSILSAGVLSGDNLDLPTAFHASGHSASAFSILAGEFEPSGGAKAWADHADVNSASQTITWATSSAKLAPQTESFTLYVISTLPPNYGTATANDGAGTTWGDSAGFPGSDAIVLPVPEPGAIVLGLLAAAFGTIRFWTKDHRGAAETRRRPD